MSHLIGSLQGDDNLIGRLPRDDESSDWTVFKGMDNLIGGLQGGMDILIGCLQRDEGYDILPHKGLVI